jgi:hypothetical protein
MELAWNKLQKWRFSKGLNDNMIPDARHRNRQVAAASPESSVAGYRLDIRLFDSAISMKSGCGTRRPPSASVAECGFRLCFLRFIDDLSSMNGVTEPELPNTPGCIRGQNLQHLGGGYVTCRRLPTIS